MQKSTTFIIGDSMELIVDEIPPEFIKSIPKGFRLVKKNQSNFLPVESIFSDQARMTYSEGFNEPCEY
jgi:hypothetical protein